MWVLVEGPGPGEADFLGRWLLAAAAADQELEEQFKRNPSLRQQIARLGADRFDCLDTRPQLDANEIGCVRISVMAGAIAPFKGPNTDEQDQLTPCRHFRLATHGRSIQQATSA